MKEPPDIEISSFAAPTTEDIARLERLTDAQRRAVVAREIRKGIESGASKLTMEDIWAEALRQMVAKSRGSNAL